MYCNPVELLLPVIVLIIMQHLHKEHMVLFSLHTMLKLQMLKLITKVI